MSGSNGRSGAPLVRYRHPQFGFSLPLPPDWQQLTDPQQGVALIATTPEREPGLFRTNAVVTVENVVDEDLEAWQLDADQELEQGLAEFVLLDEERVHLDGWVAHRRLAHHRVEQYAVTMEQWAMLHGGRGLTLTNSVESWAYDDTADLFETMGRGFRPREQEGS